MGAEPIKFRGSIEAADIKDGWALLTLQVPIDQAKQLVRAHFGDALDFIASVPPLPEAPRARTKGEE